MISCGRHTNCRKGFGGAEEARTPDLQSAILALSQLSYCPVIINTVIRKQ